MGIQAECLSRDEWWLLVVKQNDLGSAAAELESYERENPDVLSGTSSIASKPTAIYGGAALGVFAYLTIVLLIDALADHRTLGLDWFEAGEMQSARVKAGEWWRAVTALTLHLDAEHILSNLLFGAVFGFLAGRVLGGGVAWFAIVIAGAFGNLMNAMVQTATHTSIGASTAVFAALGLIVSHSLRPRMPAQQQTPLRRWSPLIGGALLFAFLGVGGERTDVMAHMTGFAAGLLIGWIGSRLPEHWPAKRAVQSLAVVATIALIASAWIVALNATE